MFDLTSETVPARELETLGLVSELACLVDRDETTTELYWSEVTRPGVCYQDRPALLQIDVVGYGDYTSHSLMERVNFQYLLDTWGEHLVTLGSGSHDGQGLAVWADAEIPTGLAKDVYGAREWCLDDDLYLQLEAELTEDAWEEYGARDMRSELRDIMGEDVVEELDDAAIRSAWEDVVSEAGEYPYAESSTSVVLWSYHSDVPTRVAEILAA